MSTNGSPRVSVIIPTYNRWPKVCDAIDSVLTQTEPSVPVVVDDCSTDATPEFLADKYGDRIQLIRQPTNQEKSAARNRGIIEATTEFLCFLDSDDTFYPEAAASLIACFDGNPEFDGASYGACTVNGEIEIPLENLPGGKVLPQYLEKPFLHTLSFMIRKSRLASVGLYREDLFNMEDIELFVRLMARMEFIPCGAVVADIEKQADSASVNYAKIIRQGTKIIDYLKSDVVAVEAMGDDFSLVQKKVYHELSRALYKSKKFGDYCVLYRQMASEFPSTFGSGRYRQRYWYARLARVFSS